MTFEQNFAPSIPDSCIIKRDELIKLFGCKESTLRATPGFPRSITYPSFTGYSYGQIRRWVDRKDREALAIERKMLR